MRSDQKHLNLYTSLVTGHVTAMLAYWDKDMVCRYANNAYKDWYGLKGDDMIDKITIRQILGQFYDKYLPYVMGALEGRPQTFEREYVMANGTTRFAIANYYPHIENGEVKGFISHVTDITQNILLENELIQKNKIISDQNNRLLNFANIVSHNLRSYSRNLEAILDMFINAETEDEKQEMLGFLKGISKGFTTTVDNLDEIVQAQNLGKKKHVEIDLHEYIEKSLEILRIQIRSANATVINKVSGSIRLSANAAYMESIILNFLTNAIKYRHPDRDPVIELDAFVKGEEVVLSIKDNGIGINLEKHGKDLFGMYKTFHGNADAHGIGLFIAKFEVESMGGYIDVESRENVGTTFTIHLKQVNNQL